MEDGDATDNVEAKEETETNQVMSEVGGVVSSVEGVAGAGEAVQGGDGDGVGGGQAGKAEGEEKTVVKSEGTDALPPVQEDGGWGAGGAAGGEGAAGEMMDWDNEDNWVPQGTPEPSLAQYTAKAKDAHTRVLKNKHDVDAWKVLVGEAQGGPMKHIKSEILQRVLQVFPTSGKHWKMYAEQLASEGKKKEAADAIEKVLPICPQLDLWKVYITLTGQINRDDPTILSKTYEKAVDSVGQDINSNALWGEYISFLRNMKVNNQYENSQRLNQLRRAYQRCLQVPMHSADRLWSEYEAWEKSLDPNNVAQVEVAVRAFEPKHKLARAAYKDRNRLRNQIQVSAFPGPFTGDPKEKACLKAWKELISFERSNAQKMLPEDLRKRVSFTYNLCLSHLPLYPEIWHQAAHWHGEIGDWKGEIKMLERGIHMLPTCLLLHLALAEKHELRGNNAAAKKVYEDLADKQPSPMVFIHYMRFARRTEGVKKAREVFKQARKCPQACSWQVFADAALREYRVNKDPVVARNVFDMGMKFHGNETQFVTLYLDFLIQLNDDNNTRVLFEKVLADDAGLDRKQALDIWNRLVEFEYSRGTLDTIQRVEMRRALLYPELRDVNGLAQLACRYRFMDEWPCGKLDLDVLDLLEEAAAPGGGRGGKRDVAPDENREDERDDAGGKRRKDRSRERSPAREKEPSRPYVPLPPIPPAMQELIDCLPQMPLFPNGPNPDEIIGMINQLIVPPQFYTPPQTMLAGVSNKPQYVPGTILPGEANQGRGESKGVGGNKRGREAESRGIDADDDGKGGSSSDMFRLRQKQRYSAIQD